MKHTYSIGSQNLTVDIQARDMFTTGCDQILSREFGDLTKNMPWHPAGYTVIEAESFFDPDHVKSEIEKTIKRIITEINSTIELDDFSLETYHQFVSDEEHAQVICKTRRLFPHDFGFDSDKIVSSLASYMGIDLSYKNPVSNSKQWIIVRINKPQSIGYNPAHKDVYGLLDNFESIPRMINVWVPVCGVTNESGLPLVPGSHLISEEKIMRSKAGSELNGQKYSVNSILSWDSSSNLDVVSPRRNELLIFSSHLIHGLAVNHNPNTTRISLEFRLYEDVH